MLFVFFHSVIVWSMEAFHSVSDFQHQSRVSYIQLFAAGQSESCCTSSVSGKQRSWCDIPKTRCLTKGCLCWTWQQQQNAGGCSICHLHSLHTWSCRFVHNLGPVFIDFFSEQFVEELVLYLYLYTNFMSIPGVTLVHYVLFRHSVLCTIHVSCEIFFKLIFWALFCMNIGWSKKRGTLFLRLVTLDELIRSPPNLTQIDFISFLTPNLFCHLRLFLLFQRRR